MRSEWSARTNKVRGPGKQLDGYRCDWCRRRKNRCVDCRARHAAARRALRERKRVAGICLQCTERAVKGQRLCDAHRQLNNLVSAAAHAQARTQRH